MPGAPNRPPEVEPTVPVADPNALRVVRRLGAARIALRLDLWKGAPSPELVQPLERAEASFTAGNLSEALSQLDLLAVRFAEPRWPSLPVPFKGLRVEIPPPTPPHWHPEHGLAPAERESRRLAREAELHRDLTQATLTWAAQHSVPLDDQAAHLEQAKALLISTGPSDAYWTEVDAIWQAVRSRVPMPKPSGKVAPAAPASETA
jgi:hypothetical protein